MEDSRVRLREVDGEDQELGGLSIDTLVFYVTVV
jgi:hypothetical protein